MALPDLNLSSSVVVGISSGFAVAIVNSGFNFLNTSRSNQNQRLIEKEKWLRDNLQEIYRNCIVNLSEFIGMFPGSSGRKEKLTQVKSWLSLILIYYPDSKSEEYKLLEEKFDNLDLNETYSFYSDLHHLIIDIAANDSRIQ